MASALAPLLLLIAAFAGPAAAIYEDQAGQYDWIKQHVGRVKLAQLTTKPRPRLYVASEAGALAALSPADGSLLWRKVLAPGDGFTHLLTLGDRLVTVSGNGRQLLAWDAESGAAAWSAALEGQSAADLTAVGSKAVAVAVGGAVKVRAINCPACWVAI
jgi:outer membrane protein assembly factor BamB